MKKTFPVTLALFLLLLAAAYAGNSDEKKFKEDFYSSIRKIFSFSKADCKAVRDTGYGANFNLVMLYIAKEAKVPVTELIAMRDNDGASFQEMCEKYGVDYEKTMVRLKQVIIENNILFPPDNDSEMRKNIITVPGKKGGK
jgi:hypothetical protein